jgi:hypothetical protein
MIAQMKVHAQLLKLAIVLTESILALTLNAIHITTVNHILAKMVFALRVLMTQTVLSG